MRRPSGADQAQRESSASRRYCATGPVGSPRSELLLPEIPAVVAAGGSLADLAACSLERDEEQATVSHDGGLASQHALLDVFIVSTAVSAARTSDRLHPRWSHGLQMKFDVYERVRDPLHGVGGVREGFAQVLDRCFSFRGHVLLLRRAPGSTTVRPRWLQCSADRRPARARIQTGDRPRGRCPARRSTRARGRPRGRRRA